MKMNRTDLQSMVSRHEADQLLIAAAEERLIAPHTERAEHLVVSFVHALVHSDVSLVEPDFITKNVYALEKGKRAIRAIANASQSMVDIYTAYIVKAMLARKTRTLTFTEQNAILAAAIECESLRATDKRLHRAESTARTQSSSTRAMLQALGIATRDQKNLTLADSPIAERFLDLFRKKKAE
jgi:hypothetical protein